MFDLSQLKVLIVDDHMLVRQYVRNALLEERITDVDYAEDGSEAVDQIDKAHLIKKPFDIVFLDWDMPMVNGMGVLSYVRKKPEYAQMAVIMLTAESEMHSIVKAMSMGATSYIIKPTTTGEIHKKLTEVYEWLQKKREGHV